MRTWLLGLVVTVTGMLLAPPAMAVPVGAGVSGQCYDAASNGGGDEVRVGTDTSDPVGSLAVHMLTVTGAVAGIAQFAMGLVATLGMGDACTNADTLDYVEADANVGGTGAQACYDGDVRTDGGCPHSPAGPGAPG
jgi:hypothetical protein